MGRVGLRRTQPCGSCFPSPLHSFRAAGFPQHGWKAAFANRAFPKSGLPGFIHSPQVRHVQGSASPCGQSLTVSLVRCVCRPAGPGLSTVYHTPDTNRNRVGFRKGTGVKDFCVCMLNKLIVYEHFPTSICAYRSRAEPSSSNSWTCVRRRHTCQGGPRSPTQRPPHGQGLVAQMLVGKCSYTSVCKHADAKIFTRSPS